MAVIAVGVVAADEPGRVPPFRAVALRKTPLCIVDDVASALNRPNVLRTVASNLLGGAGLLQHVWRLVVVAPSESVAGEFFSACGRQCDGGLADFFTLPVLMHRHEVQTAYCEQQHRNFER